MEHREYERYDPEAVEAKWQAAWAAEEAFEVPNPDSAAADEDPLEPDAPEFHIDFLKEEI